MLKLYHYLLHNSAERFGLIYLPLLHEADFIVFKMCMITL